MRTPFLLAFTLRLIGASALIFASVAVRGGESPSPQATPRDPFTLATGTIYQLGSDRKKILYYFERHAVREGDTLRVERKFLHPDRTLAAVETIVYESGQLTDYKMSQPEAGIFGGIQVAPPLKKNASSRLFIDYCHLPSARKKTDGQALQPDTLIADNLYPFILAHWEALMSGASVKFHFISLEQETAYDFQLTKVGEGTATNPPTVRLKMVPTHSLAALMVAPLFFTLEKDGEHRLLNYVGRTTPRLKKNKVWKYLDAETVLDWP